MKQTSLDEKFYQVLRYASNAGIYLTGTPYLGVLSLFFDTKGYCVFSAHMVYGIRYACIGAGDKNFSLCGDC